MAVTDRKPTHIGQRVAETYSGSRGWVTGFEGDIAFVTWDEPDPVGTEDARLFPIDDLRVVEVIVMDVDHYEDPAFHPEVEESRTGALVDRVYRLKDGTVLQGTPNARIELLRRSKTDNPLLGTLAPK